MNGTPVFELVPLPKSGVLPAELPAELFTTGVPTMGPKFRREPQLLVADAPVSGTVVCFGISSLFYRVGIELATGHVVDVLSPDLLRGPNRPSVLPLPGFVNSSLPQFVECVRLAISAFPYYSRGADLSEREAVASRVAELLRPVDPPALELDQFWSTFIDDLVIGDFPTEDIVEGD